MGINPKIRFSICTAGVEITLIFSTSSAITIMGIKISTYTTYARVPESFALLATWIPAFSCSLSTFSLSNTGTRS